jgi:hypothetical protein
VTDELHFEVQLEEGERHPSDGKALRRIEHELEIVRIQGAEQLRLLRQILEREPPLTYPQPTGMTVTVTP